MRRVLLGLMLIPGVVGAGYMASRGGRLAVASPVEAKASSRLARMLLGDFVAAPAGEGDARVGPIARKACRVDAPELGEHAVYAEDRFEHGSGRPFSQRLYVIDGDGRHHARVREFVFADPGAVRGLCDAAERPRVRAAEVEERSGCELHVSLRGDRFTGATAGKQCRSVLNGASHARRALEVRDDVVAVHDQGFDEHDAPVWGHGSAPLRFARR